MEIFVGLISLISLIVFFVMASNISDLVRQSKIHSEQNEEVIRLLGGGKPEARPRSKHMLTVSPQKMMENMKGKAASYDDAIEAAKAEAHRKI